LLGLIDVVVRAVVVVREELLTDIEARVAITGEIGAQSDLKLCESKTGEGLRDVGVQGRAGINDGEGEGGITVGVLRGGEGETAELIKGE